MSGRVLILGGSGMLGHKFWQTFRKRFDSWITLHGHHNDYSDMNLFDRSRTISGVDAQDFATIAQAFSTVRPHTAINCIGIINKHPKATDPSESISVNSLFPHRLKNLCQKSSCRLIHISTDCVFSGSKGMYSESDPEDAQDLYGRSKLLGEVDGPNCLTIRTSLIGRELRHRTGLLEWFLANQEQGVRGYTRAIFSGFPTCIFSHIVADIVDHHPDLSGIYHVSADPVAKFDLLCLLRTAFSLCVEIQPDDQVHIDRSLDSTRFRAVTGFRPQSWPDMVRNILDDQTPYDEWRRTCEP